ncbi:MAG: histidine kinase dimerization/phospho-acceptor domain-containing protein [Pseudomonadota bacterium]
MEYALAHDLRAPLRSITGFSAALLEEYGQRLDPVGRDYLERIAQASRRMNDLIEGMLHLFHVGGRELLATDVDLATES